MYSEKLKNGHFRHQIAFVEERTGKRRKVSVVTDKNTQKARREAERLLNEKVCAINAGCGSDDATLREVAEAFLKARADVWRPGTYNRYTFSIKALCGALGADSRVAKLTARYVMQSIRDAKPRAATRNELLRSFKTIMRWAYRNDFVASVEWLGKLEKFPEPPIKEKNARKYLERDELAALLPELRVDLNRYLIAFLALSGLRIGEALALQKEDVDLDTRQIAVTKTLNLRKRTIIEGAKTYTSNRSVFIQDELLDLVRDIRKYMTEMALACGFRSSFFFSDFSGRPLPYDRVNKYFRENCERVIGRSLSLHSLRHTHTSLMFEAGASLDAVSLRLGHADSRITKEIYLHITEKKRAEYDEQFRQIKILS
jgi:integrase